jgi:polyisoprenoid-binding protein YceI
MKSYLAACAVLVLAACAPKTSTPEKAEAPAAPAPAAAKAPVNTAPAGLYTLDNSHTRVSFRVNHLGFSHYTANFDAVKGKLQFDPANPAAMTVEATIDPKSLDLNDPPAGFHDEMMDKSFFDAKAFPAMTFKSTKVEVTDPSTAKVTGDLTLHGVTKPVTLAATFNGGYAANAFDGARIGFSAHGTLKRSDFGMGFGVPAPGTTLGVSDEVEIAIETEFANGAPVKAAQPG